MEAQVASEECYKLELEDLGKFTIGERQIKFAPLRFTKKNRDLILACMDIDSAYRHSFDINNQNSSAYYIKECFGDSSKYEREYLKKSKEDKIKLISEVCKRLDKENSTHLSVSSTKKDENGGKDNKSNQGIEIMAETIVTKYPDLLKALRDDKDGQMVDFLSKCVKDQIRKNDNGEEKELSKLSFASKFCTYMCRYSFVDDTLRDKFAIYDGVLCNILPYYIFKYQKYVSVELTKKMLSKTGVGSIANLTKRNGYGYKWYRQIIDGIRTGIKQEENLEISREAFDSMLWYYYKGDNELIDATYAYLKERIK